MKIIKKDQVNHLVPVGHFSSYAKALYRKRAIETEEKLYFIKKIEGTYILIRYWKGDIVVIS